MGSVLALTLALRSVGIAAMPTLADDSDAPALFDFLPGFGLFVPAVQLEVPDVFVALDTPNPERLGAAGRLAESSRVSIVIDHHPDASSFGTINILDPVAAATGQMVWRLMDSLDIAPTRDIAQCCYVALVTDTGRFSYSNTSASTLRDAADMVEAGADVPEVARLLYQNRSLASLQLEARVLSRLTVANGGKVAYSWLEAADFLDLGAAPDEAEGLPDAIRLVSGIEVALMLRRAENEVRVNLRSKTGFDVGSIARRFDGGGHVPASGFTWTGTMDELLSALLPLLPGGTDR
ncbi:MAG: bifunctional oligoribonuclease/PAP phosphatase NrnA [Coriobacteriia bacterium]|nr:bifunctional oligoribonuclease/PAP phosphatase NrnA [Coriobacteriia bacterium]